MIDFHTHVEEAPELGLVDPPERLIDAMDTTGVHAAVCTTYTDWPVGSGARDGLAVLADAMERYPGRLFGFARLDPAARGAEEALRHAVDHLGLHGLKLHPTATGVDPGEPSCVALVRVASDLDVPVLFHTGDDTFSSPWAVASAAEAVPDAVVVLGHMGGYLHVDDAIVVAERLDNVFLETSAMPYPGKVAEAVARVGPGRVLYGSDGPRCNMAVELRKVALAALAPPEEALVLGGNATRLLHLERTGQP